MKLGEPFRKFKRAIEIGQTLSIINKYRKKPIRLCKRIGPVETFAKLGIPPDAKVIFDVGANVGEFALMANEYFYEPEIYCFEPVRSTYEQLTKNVETTKNIKTFQFGFFDKNQTIPINITSFHPANSILQLSEDYKKCFGRDVKKTDEKELITVQKLDDFVTENKVTHIDVLKIDVEGVEYEVLEGGKQTLSKMVNRIYVEVSLVRKGRKNSEFLRLYSLLDSLGFALETFHCVDYKKIDWYETVSQFDTLFTKKKLME